MNTKETLLSLILDKLSFASETDLLRVLTTLQSIPAHQHQKHSAAGSNSHAARRKRQRTSSHVLRALEKAGRPQYSHEVTELVKLDVPTIEHSQVAATLYRLQLSGDVVATGVRSNKLYSLPSKEKS